MDLGCVLISNELEKDLKKMMKDKAILDKRYHSLKEYIPALLQSLAEKSN